VGVGNLLKPRNYIGYPICTLPLGYLDLNGRPFALAAITRAHGEALLVGVMATWERTFGERKVPLCLDGGL